MTGTCKICRQLILGNPVRPGLLGAEFEAAEFMALAESMREHLHQYHRKYLQAYGGLVELVVRFLSLQFIDAAEDESFQKQLACLMEGLCIQLRECRVNVVAAPAAEGPR